MLLLCFSISGIAFYKRGVIFPCLKKSNTLSPTMLPPGKLLFTRGMHCSLSLLPAFTLSSFLLFSPR
jgi:hypothetical protein